MEASVPRGVYFIGFLRFKATLFRAEGSHSVIRVEALLLVLWTVFRVQGLLSTLSESVATNGLGNLLPNNFN